MDDGRRKKQLTTDKKTLSNVLYRQAVDGLWLQKSTLVGADGQKTVLNGTCTYLVKQPLAEATLVVVEVLLQELQAQIEDGQPDDHQSHHLQDKKKQFFI